MRKTKSLSFTPLLILPLLLLSSCIHYGTLRTNYIEAGVYIGPDLTNTYACTLVVTSITKAEYNEADGVNVVRDVVKDGYYRLSFSAVSESETITYDFLSLEDPYNGAPKTFAAYRDINHSWFEPYDPNFSSSRKSKEEHMKCTVTIVYAEDTEIVASQMMWNDPNTFE